MVILMIEDPLEPDKDGIARITKTFPEVPRDHTIVWGSEVGWNKEWSEGKIDKGRFDWYYKQKKRLKKMRKKFHKNKRPMICQWCGGKIRLYHKFFNLIVSIGEGRKIHFHENCYLQMKASHLDLLKRVIKYKGSNIVKHNLIEFEKKYYGEAFTLKDNMVPVIHSLNNTYSCITKSKANIYPGRLIKPGEGGYLDIAGEEDDDILGVVQEDPITKQLFVNTIYGLFYIIKDEDNGDDDDGEV